MIATVGLKFRSYCSIERVRNVCVCMQTDRWQPHEVGSHRKLNFNPNSLENVFNHEISFCISQNDLFGCLSFLSNFHAKFIPIDI